MTKGGNAVRPADGGGTAVDSFFSFADWAGAIALIRNFQLSYLGVTAAAFHDNDGGGDGTHERMSYNDGDARAPTMAATAVTTAVVMRGW